MRTTTASRRCRVVIHGDAAFAGQGVVAEMLNLGVLNGLRDRRHHPHHHQQPDRLHHRQRWMRARRATRPTWPRASTSPSSTSMPTIRRAASARIQLAMAYRQKFQRDVADRPRWAIVGTATTRATSRATPSRSCTTASRRCRRCGRSMRGAAGGRGRADERRGRCRWRASAYQRLVDIQQAFKASTGKTSAAEVRKQVVAGPGGGHACRAGTAQRPSTSSC